MMDSAGVPAGQATDATSLGQRIALWSVVAIVFAAPLAMSRLVGAPPLTHDTYQLPKVVLVRCLVAIGLLAWGSTIALRGGRVRMSWWLAPIGIYVGWTALATLLSPAPLVSLLGVPGRLDGLSTAITYGLLSFLALQVIRGADDLAWVLRATSSAGLLVGAYGVLQILNLDVFYYLPGTRPGDYMAEYRAFSTLGNADFLGQYLVLAAPIALVSALTDESRAWRVVGWLSLSAVLAGSYATRGRVAWLMLAVEVVLVTVVLLRRRGVSGKTIGVALLSTSFAIGVAATAVALSSTWAYRWGAAALRRDALDRTAIWSSALRGMAARPLFGFGPDRFTQVTDRFPPIGSADLARVSTDTAHNTTLQIAATAGFVAAVAWLTAAVWPLVAAAGDVFSTKGGRGRLMLAGLWIGAVGYLVSLQAGVSTVDATSVFWIVAACLVGPQARGVVVEPLRWGRAVPVVLGVLLAGAVAWSATQVAANNAYLQGRMRLRGTTSGSIEGAYAQAIAFAPLDFYYRRALGVELAYRQPPPSEALAAVDAGLHLEPEDIELVVARSRLDALRGDTAALQDDMARALELAPESELVRGLRQPASRPSTSTTP